MVIARACDRLGWTLAGQRCVVQGFGNVGGVAARRVEALGATVIAVSDVSGGLHAASGLDIAALHAFVLEHGSLEGCDAGRAAHERGAARARLRHPRSRRPRGPDHRGQRATPPDEADRGGCQRPDVARGRRDPLGAGIPVLPDILTNAGGVTVSYFEWVQDLGPSLLDARRDPREARREALERVRPRVGSRRGAQGAASHGRARRRDPRGVGRTQARGISLNTVRDAMVSNPGQLPATRSAQAAGELLQRPEVRAVYVTEDERLVGVVTRKTLVREVIAHGPTESTEPRAIAERRTSQSGQTSRSRRRSASSRPRTPSAFRSWTSTIVSSACSRAACCSAGSPRTRTSRCRRPRRR